MNENAKSVRSRFALSAGALTQLLAAVACFLGAFVLPNTFREFRGMSGRVLVVLGFVMLCLGILNIAFGRQIGRLMSRAGKRSRVVIPREGIGFLAIMLTLAVGALMGHRNMPLLVFGMMAGPFVLNGAIVYRMLKGIRVTRRAPRRAVAGEFVGVELQIANDKKFMASHMLEVRDRITGRQLTAQRRDDEGTVTFVRVPGKEQRVGRYQIRFADRGRYRLGPIRISSRFPLGIGERGQLFQDTTDLIVHPQLGHLLPRWVRQQKELSESNDRRHSRPGFFDDEFHRIREYRSGDNPRSIHWRSTAKRGELMIREHEQNRQSDSLIILDLPESEDWSRAESELAISFAATICVAQTHASSGSRYLLALATKQPVVIASRSPAGFREEALDALAMCSRSSRASLDDVLTAVMLGHDLLDERLIIITPRPEEAAAAVDRTAALLTRETFHAATQVSIMTATNAGLADLFQLTAVEDPRDSSGSSNAGHTAASPVAEDEQAQAAAPMEVV